jgi:exopolyphosphatase/guanosine-5'-triphosphate,3'-diphosphate pyrophosphatase
MSRCAAIDVGTNSVKITVADLAHDGGLDIIARQLHVTQLGRDSAADGTLATSSMERTIDALLKLIEMAMTLEPSTIRMVATQALRAAPNRLDFIQEVHARCGLDLELLQPTEEASLSWRAICADQQIGTGSSVLLDVGGGSAECLFASGEEIEDVISMPLGALTMTDRFTLDGHIEEASWSAFTAHVHTALAAALPGRGGTSYAWAVGGTCTAMVGLDRMGIGLSGGTDVVPPTSEWSFTGLGMDRLQQLVSQLRHWTLEERVAATGLDRDRAAIIPAGGFIMQALLDHLGVVSGCCVTHHGVRDGLLRDMLGDSPSH